MPDPADQPTRDAAASEAGVEPGDPAATLGAGATLGRYVLCGELGEGGMSVVHEAYDPELDRKVAIKVLQSTGDVAAERLLREAHALARLNHPNVVHVYDVGELDKEVFLVQELLGGGTLRGWLAARPRSWREVIDVFRAVGAGLAAAHEAGLVHRDVKPDNILFDAAGRVRLADFGLVRGGAAADTADAADDAARPRAKGTPLTQAGRSLGTPGYMSPEQQAGRPVDARSDQYSFCATLHEALFGALPGDDPPAEPPPPARRIPSRVRAALARGLAADPLARFPSIDALLEVLGRDRSPVWRRRALLAATAVVAAAAAVVVVRATAHRQSCAGAARKLAGVWDPEVAGRLRAGFFATGRPYAAESARRVSERLDRYVGEVDAMYRDACQATFERKEQSGLLLDRRIHCLDELLVRTGALTRLLSESPTVAAVDRASLAVAALGDVAACADVERLAATEPPPSDPDLRAAVDVVDRELAQSSALGVSGSVRSGLQQAAKAESEARRLGNQPLVARAVLELAAARSRAGDRAAEAGFREVVTLASALHDDVLVAHAWQGLVGLLLDGDRTQEAAPLIFALDAATARAGGGPRDAGTTLWLRSRSEQALGHFAPAEQLIEQAIDILERAGAANDVMVRRAVNQLGNVCYDRREWDKARASYERVLALCEAIDGPQHPNVAAALSNLAGLLCEIGDPESAKPLLERALAIRTAAFGPDSDDVAITHTNMGFCADVAERFTEAEPHFAAALAIYEKRDGPDSPSSFQTLLLAGEAAREGGRLELAADQILRAQKIAEAAFGPDQVNTAYAAEAAGGLELVREDPAAAVRQLRHAVDIFDRVAPGELAAEEARGVLALALCRADQAAEGLPLAERAAAAHRAHEPDSIGLAWALLDLATCQLAAGKEVDLAEIDHAIAIQTGKPLRLLLGRLRFVAAQAHWAAGDDRGRAVALTRAARDDLRAIAPGGAADLRHVEAWLAEHAR